MGPVGRADGDSGLRGGVGAGGKPGPLRPVLEAPQARPSLRQAWGSACPGRLLSAAERLPLPHWEEPRRPGPLAPRPARRALSLSRWVTRRLVLASINPPTPFFFFRCFLVVGQPSSAPKPSRTELLFLVRPELLTLRTLQMKPVRQNGRLGVGG